MYSIGLGEKEGNAFSAGYSVYNVGGTHLEDKTDGKIQIKKLDDMQIIDRVAFIKIDVEGMESSVLRGGMNLIRENLPYIMVESFGRKFIQVRELLCALGYTYESLDSGDNWLFCPGK